MSAQQCIVPGCTSGVPDVCEKHLNTPLVARVAALEKQLSEAKVALRNVIGVWSEIHDDAKGRRMWVLGWETWLKVIAAAAVTGTTSDNAPFRQPESAGPKP